MGNQAAWYRIDNRLVHGQVIENWIPYTRTKSIIVVNDELASDELQKEIIGLAVPSSLRIVFTSVRELMHTLDGLFKQGKGLNGAFFLFACCRDAKRAFEQGLHFEHLNIGNIHYGPGRKPVCDHVALSKEDAVCLRHLSREGVDLDFRCVPNTPVQVKEFLS